MYLPPGYGSGQNVEGVGWSFDFGTKEIDNDYYITLNPLIELPLGKLMVGLQIPLEILAYDVDPKLDQKVPSLRKGTFDDADDYIKLIAYLRYGTHLYYNAKDSFNWSVFYGKMNDGYIGHQTIIRRYVNSYDSTVYVNGVMADINNKWGGIEVFSSDLIRKEVVGGRGYIRPFGIFYAVHDIFLGHSGLSSGAGNYAISIDQERNPDLNGGIFFQEKIGDKGRKGGRIGQYTHRKIKDDINDVNENNDVKFEEYKDPVTGKTQVRAIPVTKKIGDVTKKRGGPTGTQKDPKTRGGRKDPTGLDKTKKGSEDRKDRSDDEKREKWGATFWGRWAIGYTIVRDLTAPLSIDRDGSNNMIIDPETQRPRSLNEEVLTFVGVDTEFRLSPFRFMDFTPYVDFNKIKNLDKSTGLHAGLNLQMRFFKKFLKISFRPEYREISSNYMPEYFDSYYTLERTMFVDPNSSANSTTSSDDGELGNNTITKLSYLQSLDSREGISKGYYFSFMIEIFQWLVIESNFEDYDGPNNSKIFVGIYVPNIAGFFLNGYYTKKGFGEEGDSFNTQLQDAFDFDDRSLMAGEVGFTFFGSFYVKASYQRTWEFNAITSVYEAIDEKAVNFGYSSNL